MGKREVNDLAEKIARILESESTGGNPSIESSIEKINLRLDGIERRLTSNPDIKTSTFQHSHPSTDKFDVIEAIADQIIDHQNGEKTCTFEPNGKPCDHCSMCNSRGF